MDAKIIGHSGTWYDVYRVAMKTVGKTVSSDFCPSDQWKRKILLAEHSPIRMLRYQVLLEGVKSWVSTHLVRHHIGIEHFVKTQRSDRTGIDRNELTQSCLVDHVIDVNAQALITISRRRLCGCASEETRDAWSAVIDAVHTVDPIVASVCVPDCVYRGACFEFSSCGAANHYDNSIDRQHLAKG